MPTQLDGLVTGREFRLADARCGALSYGYGVETTKRKNARFGGLTPRPVEAY